MYECFRCMQPGTPLLALHGKIKQARRTHIYFDFVRRPSAVLFATDIAARGLDFPECDWVVQVRYILKRIYLMKMLRTRKALCGLLESVGGGKLQAQW